MTGTFAGRQPRLGILGAGRLGAAIALRWRSIGNQEAKVWSRRFDHHDADKPDDLPFGVASIASVMSAYTVIAAIPSSGLAELASHHRSITEFSGTLLVTGIDLPLKDIQRVVPGALVARVIPALLSAPHSIPCLVLNGGHAGEHWDRAETVIKMLGPVHCVSDERTLETLMYLTSPFPVVLRSALADMVASTLAQSRVDPEWQPLAEQVLWQALSSIASTLAQSDSIEAEVATPGGVTATGLREVPTISRALQDALQIMMRHGRRPRDR